MTDTALVSIGMAGFHPETWLRGDAATEHRAHMFDLALKAGGGA